MEADLAAMCGAYCGDCEWKEKTGCPGCKASKGKLFWGECRIARCCIDSEQHHCGTCPKVPCELLRSAFEMPEHGDNGERLQNLLLWAAGEERYVKLTKRK